MAAPPSERPPRWLSSDPDKAWAERWLLGYASCFVIGLPLVARVDEDGERWSPWRVLVEALAACMLILCLLEVWAKLVGPL